MGQGTQRLVILSILKAYTDLLLERSIISDNLTLIVFEEPEVYLHPKLKKELNNVLRKIGNTTNHQVIITTHDPYFASSNFNDEDGKVFSFEKNGDCITEVKSDTISGIEDELLHILLFNMAIKLTKMDLSKFGSYLLEHYSESQKMYIDDRDTKKEEKTIALPIYIRHQIHHADNKLNKPFSIKELAQSIKVLNDVLCKFRG